MIKTTSLTPKITAISISAGLLLVLFTTTGAIQTSFATGNGAPSGAHYNLNLIGVKKTDQLPTDTNNGHRIFVNLQGNSKIYLYPGDFAVLDADATDGKGAFQLPDPALHEYTVWARAVGTPGGNGQITTCATDPVTLEQVCSLNSVILMRTNGKQSFTNVTNELTTLCTATLGCVNIFDPAFENYLWSYDNNGLKVVQLRFYQVS